VNIYVGNLSPDITDQELSIVFGTFGEVFSVVIISDKYVGSGKTGAHGFVQMLSKFDGAAAIAGLKGTSLKGKMIEVVEALPLSDKKKLIPDGWKDNSPNKAGRSARH
jgi:RNA recognition motif-containing protein